MSCNKTASTSKKPQSCFHQLQDWRDVQGVIKTVFQVKPFGIPLGLWGAAVPMALEMCRCWKDAKVECTKKHQEIYIYIMICIYIYISRLYPKTSKNVRVPGTVWCGACAESCCKRGLDALDFWAFLLVGSKRAEYGWVVGCYSASGNRWYLKISYDIETASCSWSNLFQHISSVNKLLRTHSSHLKRSCRQLLWTKWFGVLGGLNMLLHSACSWSDAPAKCKKSCTKVHAARLEGDKGWDCRNVFQHWKGCRITRSNPIVPLWSLWFKNDREDGWGWFRLT